MTVNSERQKGRPREFDEADILSKIMSVFWSLGYEATKLSDIVSATGLQKGSLYKVFSGKQDMYLKALAHYDETIVQEAIAYLTLETSTPAKERLENFLSAPLNAVWERGERRGCFLCNACLLYTSPSPRDLSTSRMPSSA